MLSRKTVPDKRRQNGSFFTHKGFSQGSFEGSLRRDTPLDLWLREKGRCRATTEEVEEGEDDALQLPGGMYAERHINFTCSFEFSLQAVSPKLQVGSVLETPLFKAQSLTQLPVDIPISGNPPVCVLCICIVFLRVGLHSR